MLLFFCCSSGIQSGARFTAWEADQACGIYLQAVCLDNLTFLFVRKYGCWFAFFAVFRLFDVHWYFYHCLIFKPFLHVFINQYSRLTESRYGDIMIIYSRFWLFLSCLLCSVGTDPGRSVRTVVKVCSVLEPLYNRPIRLFNGRLYSGRRVIDLSVLRALWVYLGRQLLALEKSPAPVRRWSAGFYKIGRTGYETNDISGGSWIFAIFRHAKSPKNG